MVEGDEAGVPRQAEALADVPFNELRCQFRRAQLSHQHVGDDCLPSFLANVRQRVRRDEAVDGFDEPAHAVLGESGFAPAPPVAALAGRDDGHAGHTAPPAGEQLPPAHLSPALEAPDGRQGPRRRSMADREVAGHALEDEPPQSPARLVHHPLASDAAWVLALARAAVSGLRFGRAQLSAVAAAVIMPAVLPKAPDPHLTATLLTESGGHVHTLFLRVPLKLARRSLSGAGLTTRARPRAPAMATGLCHRPPAEHATWARLRGDLRHHSHLYFPICRR